MPIDNCGISTESSLGEGIRSGDCDSIRWIEKPLLEFIELYNRREEKP